MGFREVLFALGGEDAQQAYAAKQQRRVTQGLANYLGKGDEAGLRQAYDADPVQAFNTQGVVEQRQQAEADRRRTEFERRAKFMRNLPPEQRAMAYPQIRAQYAQIDPETASMLPEQWSEDLIPALDELLGGGQQQEGRPGKVVNGRLVDPVTGQVIYESPQAPTRAQLVDVPDGQGGSIKMWADPTTRRLIPLGEGGGSAPQQGQTYPDAMVVSGDDEFNALPPQVRAEAQRLSEAGQPWHISNGQIVPGESPGLRQPPQGAPAPTMQPPGGGLGYTPPKAEPAPANYRYNASGVLEPIPGGPADPNRPAPPRPLTAEGAMKVSLLENAARAALQWQSLVTNPDGSYNDIRAQSPQAEALLRQAISAKLRAESGATITPQEIENEVARYHGGLLRSMISSDATNTKRANNLIDDLRSQITGQGPQGQEAWNRAFSAAQPTAGQIKILSIREKGQ